MTPARVVDEDPTHHLRCGSKEVGSVPPIHVPLINQAKVDLVDERRRLKCVALALSA